MSVPTVAIGDVAIVNRKAPPLATENGAMVPFIPMAGVEEGGTAYREERRPLAELARGYTYFERGDLLVAKITPCFENGKVAHLDALSHAFGFGSTEFHVLTPGPNVEPHYLFHALRTSRFRRAGVSSMTGSAGQQRVPARFVATYRIPLPSIPEQQRIAAVLEKGDAVRRESQACLRLLSRMKVSVFHELFGENLFDGRWEQRRVADVVTETQYGTSLPANDDGRGRPILRMNNLTPNGEIDLTDIRWCDIRDQDLPKYTVRRGDLLFNRTNSPELVGKTAVWNSDEPYAVAGYLIRARCNEKQVLPDFVSGYLNSAHGKKLLFERAKPSINMSNISASEFKRLPLPLPPLALQRKYAAIIHEMAKLSMSLGARLKIATAMVEGLSSQYFHPSTEPNHDGRGDPNINRFDFGTVAAPTAL